MKQVISAVWVIVLTLWGHAAMAQDQVWLQVEAQPNLRLAEERARDFAGRFGDVAGFRMGSNWYAIVIGPVAADRAAAQLASLKATGQIPRDSFVADGTNFRQQFWPVGAAGEVLSAADPVALADPQPEPAGIENPPDEPVAAESVPAEPVPAESVLPPLTEETVAEARQSEAELSQSDRELLQTAMKWVEVYPGAIDGAFGPGTRKAMAQWQSLMGMEQTGVLTTAQRATLVGNYQADLAALGLELVREQEAGIEITLPTALVSFDHYDPPFVHYKEKDGSGVSVLLISQAGDQGTLFGLYDIMQTLQIVPPEGERTRKDDSFTLTGQSATLKSYTYAALKGGLVKGFTLVWKPADDARMARVLAAMQSSFAPFGDRAMDDSVATQTDAQRRGMLAGLEVRRPAFSRTGFYIDANGTVLTTSDAVQSCTRVTLDGLIDADVTLTDTSAGLAVLKPRVALSPVGYAGFQTGQPRLQSEVAVAGYSYEDQLPAPTLTFGTLEDVTGLDGQPGLRRLAMNVLPGDAGGPVVDTSGSVVGMLLPRATDGRVLPAEVNFAADSAAIAAVLQAGGVSVSASTRSGGMPPEELATVASAMTVLVSCWN